LRQALAGYRFVQQQIAELDQEIAKGLAELAPPVANSSGDAPKHRVATKNAPAFDAHSLLQRLCGVDLCTVPGLSVLTVQTAWSEIGTDLSAFPTSKHFASWLGLCPDNRISGGKLLGVRTRPTANRLSGALRLAAQALHHAKNELGDYYRRMRAKLGGAAAITATAHKLARILYAMLKNHRPYNPELHNAASERHRQRSIDRLKAKAKDLGFKLIPSEPQSAVS
jgi:transposase